MLTIKNITRSAIASTFMAVTIPLNLSIGIVPFTLTVLVLSLLALILKPKEFFCSLLVYWALIVIGLPVAVGYRGGIDRFISMWGGYLWGYMTYPFASIFISRTNKSIFKLFILIFSLLILYAFGVLGLMLLGQYSITNAFRVGMVPFIIIDTFKILIAFVIYKKILFRVE